MHLKNWSYFFIILIFFGMLLSCKTAGKLPPNSKSIEQNNSAIEVKVTAINLSEDMSRMSTKDDEILVIIYENVDAGQLAAPVVTCQLKFNNSQLSNGFTWNNAKSLHGKNLLFLLMEQDSESSVDHLDSIFRIHHKEIIEGFNKRNYTTLEKFIGDDDILGAKVIEHFESNKKSIFIFKGTYRLDKYEYLVEFKPN